MLLKDRMLTVVGCVLGAVVLNLALAATALAEVDGDGDGFDGDEVLLPLGILAVAIVVGIVLWRSRRSRPRVG